MLDQAAISGPFGGVNGRQIHPKFRALGQLGFGIDQPAMLADDACRSEQSQAHPPKGDFQ